MASRKEASISGGASGTSQGFAKGPNPDRHALERQRLRQRHLYRALHQRLAQLRKQRGEGRLWKGRGPKKDVSPIPPTESSKSRKGGEKRTAQRCRPAGPSRRGMAQPPHRKSQPRPTVAAAKEGAKDEAPLPAREPVIAPMQSPARASSFQHVKSAGSASREIGYGESHGCLKHVGLA